MRWRRALDVLVEYHTHDQVGKMVGASASSVSGWCNGRNEPGHERKRRLVEVADERYPREMNNEEAEVIE